VVGLAFASVSLGLLLDAYPNAGGAWMFGANAAIWLGLTLRRRKGIEGPHWKFLLGGGAFLIGVGVLAELARRAFASGSPQLGQMTLAAGATVAGLLLFVYGVRWRLGVAAPLRLMKRYRQSSRTPNVDFLIPGGLFFLTGGLIITIGSLGMLITLPRLLVLALAAVGLASLVLSVPLAFWEPDWLRPRWMRERRRALMSFVQRYEGMVADETAAIHDTTEQLAEGLEHLNQRRIEHAGETLIKLLEGRIQRLQSVERPREYQDVVDGLVEADQELVIVANALRSAPLQDAHDRRFILGAALSTRNEVISEISQREGTVEEFYGRDKG
jgi:hypothetical protein